MAANSPGKQEEDPETATNAKRQDGVGEAGIGQGCVWSKQVGLRPSLQMVLVNSSLFSARQSSV